MENVSETPPKDIDPYSTLNLTPTATTAEIRTAYKKLALKYHPGKAQLRVSLGAYHSSSTTLYILLPIPLTAKTG